MGTHSLHRPITAANWHPTEYLRILYKRRWVAIPGFLLLFVTGAIASLRTTPLYEARTQLMVEKDARRATSIDSMMADRESWYEDAYYATQHRILQSRQLAARTVAELERNGPAERVPEESAFTLDPRKLLSLALSGVKRLAGQAPPAASGAPSPDAVQSAKVDRFLAGLAVVPVRSSVLVDLRYRSPDPEYATRAVNTLAAQYIQSSLDQRVDASKEMNAWLSQQLDEQRLKVEASDRALQEYKERNNTVALDDRENIVIQKLSALNQELTEARIVRFDREARYQQLMERQRSGGSIDDLPGVATSEFAQALKKDLLAQQMKQAQLREQGFGENYPALRAVTLQIEEIQGRLAAEIQRAAATMKADYETAQAKETRLAQALEAQKRESLGQDRKAIEYAALAREADSNRQLYQSLLLHTKETGVSNEYRGTNIQVVDPAEIPQWPVLPNTSRDLLMATLGGLALGLLLAFGFEYFDSRIKSPEEIKTHLGLPFLGMIPVAPGAEQSNEAPMLGEAVAPAFGESIRALRTAILFSSTAEGARSVTVTSTAPSEGKTVVSSSLAIALAQAGQRTLLVDADLRRPRIHDAIGRPQEPGLSNALVGDVPLTDAVRTTTVANLSVLTAGHIPPNPAELLGSAKYTLIFEELKKRFDWIIVDAPPVMPVTDSAIVARSSDGVLFVVGSEMTARHSAQNAIEHLKAANVKFIGAVLNKVNVFKHSYYYAPYYRKDYAKYYQRSGAGVRS